MKKRYALVADESGNEGDAVQALAGLSGPFDSLVQLERDLRAVLKRHGLKELKWSQVRTRRPRLAAAREFLSLASSRAWQGELALDLLVVEARSASKAWLRLGRAQRFSGLYRALLRRALKRWKGRLMMLPDQRSGVRWKSITRGMGVHSLREASSANLALVQLADLLAGMARGSRLEPGSGEPGRRARHFRAGLMAEFAAWAPSVGIDSRGRLVSKGRKAQFRIWEIRKRERG